MSGVCPRGGRRGPARSAPVLGDRHGLREVRLPPTRRHSPTLDTRRRYTYTAADVAAVLERKRARGEGARNAALERARLERERDAAEESGDAVRQAE